MPRMNEQIGRPFVVFWALAALFHVASFAKWGLTPLHPILVITAILALFRPADGRWFVAMAGLQLAEVAITAPNISNHWMLAAVVNVALLRAAWAIGFISETHGIVRLAAPTIRIVVIAFYGFVVLHKLNDAFADPGVSCGVIFHRAQVDLGPIAERATIYLTLLSEAAIPLLLCVPATRLVGVLVAVLFHAVVAANPTTLNSVGTFYNFSAVLTPLFLCFLSSTWLSSAWATLTREHAIALIGFAAVAVLGGFGWFGAWAVLTVGVVMVLVRAVVRQVRGDVVRGPVFAAPVVLVLLTGASPYLGLKTETSFAMYSNLRTEGGITNHWFIPAAQPFAFQRDLVTIHESSDPWLQARADANEAVPLFEVRRRAPASVTYERDGRVVEALSGETRSLPWWLGKVLVFRPVDREGPQRCRH